MPPAEVPSMRMQGATAHRTRNLAGFCFALCLAATQAFAQSEPSAEEQARLAAADDGAQPLVAAVLPFSDPFDGSALLDHWQVVNDDRDFYLVEDGRLLILTNGGEDHYENPQSRNLFALQKGVPEGDFDLTLRARLDPKTGYDEVWVGLRESEANFVAARLQVYTKGCGPSLYLSTIANQPLAVGEEPVRSEFKVNLFDGQFVRHLCSKAGRAEADALLAALFDKGFSLTLARRGFRYQAQFRFAEGVESVGQGVEVSRSVARTAPFGNPVFMLGQDKRAKGGESLVEIDRISLTRPGQK